MANRQKKREVLDLSYKIAIPIIPIVIAKQAQSLTLSAGGRFKQNDLATEIKLAIKYNPCPSKNQEPITHCAIIKSINTIYCVFSIILFILTSLYY
jgi:hypothetical protein